MRIRPTIGNVAGVLALSIVIGGGTAYAAPKFFQPRTFTVSSSTPEFNSSERFTTAQVSCPAGSVCSPAAVAEPISTGTRLSWCRHSM